MDTDEHKRRCNLVEKVDRIATEIEMWGQDFEVFVPTIEAFGWRRCEGKVTESAPPFFSPARYARVPFA